jgi:predicted NBD/HSP70 family sugar kinase
MPRLTWARGSFGPGALLRIIRDSPSWTKAELAEQSGLGRTAVAQRLELLQRSGYVTVNERQVLTGGRPAETYSYNADAGRLLVADIGGSHTRLGVTDLSGRLIGSAEADLHTDDGPDDVVGYVAEHLQALAHDLGVNLAEIRGIGVGVPGPVAEGVMQRRQPAGWEGVYIPRYFQRAFPGLPVAVDKDANILARGEQSRDKDRYVNVVVLKVGMGIGCGVIVDGRVLQGAQGAAGDIGHMPRGGDVQCTCGQRGCLEAIASGRSVARALSTAGRTVRTSREIVELVRHNDFEAIELVRQVGRDLGGPLGFLATIVSPSLIIVGGNLAESPEPLLAGIRETIYREFPPAMTGGLEIVPSAVGAAAGLAGAAELALDSILLPENVDAHLS